MDESPHNSRTELMQRHNPDLAPPPQAASGGVHRPGVPPAHPHLPPYSLGRADGLPPLKAQRRSRPYGFLNSSPIPPRAPAPAGGKAEADWENASSDGAGERRSSESLSNELFSTYINFDPDVLNIRDSGSRNNGGAFSSGSSSMNESGISEPQRKDGNKCSAPLDIIPMGPRHNRNMSMDSVFAGKLNFGEESPRLPPSGGLGQHSRNGSNDKLAEMAISDPKRVKRILANRQSAARSKERKARYISELEHKVQTLQSEATTLSTQLTVLQRDATLISHQNNEMRVSLQAIEQNAYLREGPALNLALSGEVQRLKMTIAAESGETQLSNSLNRQVQLNPQMFQVQQMYQMQQQQLQNNQVFESETNNTTMSQ